MSGERGESTVRVLKYIRLLSKYIYIIVIIAKCAPTFS